MSRVPLEELREVENLILLECWESFVYSLGTFYQASNDPLAPLFRSNLLWRLDLHLDLPSFIRTLSLQLPVNLVLPVFAFSWTHCIRIIVPLVVVDLVRGKPRCAGYA